MNNCINCGKECDKGTKFCSLYCYDNWRNKNSGITPEIRLKIKNLRSSGLGYKRIAKQLGLNVTVVKNFVNYNKLAAQEVNSIRYCKLCGKKFNVTRQQMTKIYCGADCRNAAIKLIRRQGHL